MQYASGPPDCVEAGIQARSIPVPTQRPASGWLGVEGVCAVFLVWPRPAVTITAAKPAAKRLRPAQRLPMPSWSALSGDRWTTAGQSLPTARRSPGPVSGMPP